jgi:hypothetical protein
MDILDVLSSESEENQQSSHSDGKDTVHTDSNKSKTKNIKKNYEPISEAGKTYRYEDNPQEYKRMRK